MYVKVLWNDVQIGSTRVHHGDFTASGPEVGASSSEEETSRSDSLRRLRLGSRPTDPAEEQKEVTYTWHDPSVLEPSKDQMITYVPQEQAKPPSLELQLWDFDRFAINDQLAHVG